MPSPRFQVVPSTYLVVLRQAPDQPGPRTEVLLQLRRGTGYMDGWWACGAAGHVEAGESFLQTATREAAEELGIEVHLDDLEPVSVLHRHVAISTPLEERIDVFVRPRRWTGEPALQEPDKAADLRWWPLDALPERTVPHEAQVLTALAEAHELGERVPPLMTRGFDQTLTLVVAVGENGAIGRDGGLPWHLPADLKHFKDTTMGGTMVMGRRTFESFGRPLPGRRHVVLTSDRDWLPGGQVDPCDREAGPRFPEVLVARTWAEALLMAGDGEVFVLGGAGVFADALPHADRLVVSEVHQAPQDADTFFPEIGPDWREISRRPADGFEVVEYRRG
ncbi:dihydrofolate reductase [Kytococcus schroeteri]|uniref:dihydrofolate reductase n=1 Tax=Kytococcus schroeteri TaxID=138300 RepID=A0A2I1P9N6_9MICO|nr:dihydrofolate reductase [Kytococcus schroeteri]PKZ41312.1 dihydrofolate reductase [Kytococcus schroeteri]